MRFEHLLQINDPLLPGHAPISREQLWRGLARRVEEPALFMPGLDACTILERREHYVKRELRFGAIRFVDHVHLDPGRRIRHDSDLADRHAGSSLTVTIEERPPGALWVRFIYDTVPADASDAGPDYDEARRSAYRTADIDAIRRIREWAAQGLLGD
jgi:hypothetical protein